MKSALDLDGSDLAVTRSHPPQPQKLQTAVFFHTRSSIPHRLKLQTLTTGACSCRWPSSSSSPSSPLMMTSSHRRSPPPWLVRHPLTGSHHHLCLSAALSAGSDQRRRHDMALRPGSAALMAVQFSSVCRSSSLSTLLPS
jgi:hypothetical protein